VELELEFQLTTIRPHTGDYDLEFETACTKLIDRLTAPATA
jgi:hypothetical protein